MKIIGAILFAAVCKGQGDTAKFRYGRIEDMEIDLPDNPEGTSFKFEPLRVEKMSRAGWDGFIETQLRRPRRQPPAPADDNKILAKPAGLVYPCPTHASEVRT